VSDQALARDDLAGMNCEQREDGALSLSAELKGLLSVPNLERTEDPDLEHEQVLAPSHEREQRR
jgi:hypothetical protein